MDERITKKQETKDEGIGCFGNIILLIVAVLIAIPFSIKHYNWFTWIPINDFMIRISLVFILFIMAYFWMLRQFKYVALIIIIGLAIFMSINEFRGKGFAFSKAGQIYLDLLDVTLKKNPAILYDAKNGIIEEVKGEIVSAVDYTDPKLKQFANKAATTYFIENDDELFKSNGSIVRYFSVFKTINSQWKYVEDPKDAEYFAKASESIETMAGDCDDHTALMTACITAIGGNARMVWVENHIFPVVWVANDRLEFNLTIKPLIEVLFSDYYRGDYLRIIENKEGIWLNFDYTAKYPGGPFLNQNIIKFISIK